MSVSSAGSHKFILKTYLSSPNSLKTKRYQLSIADILCAAIGQKIGKESALYTHFDQIRRLFPRNINSKSRKIVIKAAYYEILSSLEIENHKLKLSELTGLADPSVKAAISYSFGQYITRCLFLKHALYVIDFSKIDDLGLEDNVTVGNGNGQKWGSCLLPKGLTFRAPNRQAGTNANGRQPDLIALTSLSSSGNGFGFVECKGTTGKWRSEVIEKAARQLDNVGLRDSGNVTTTRTISYISLQESEVTALLIDPPEHDSVDGADHMAEGANETLNLNTINNAARLTYGHYSDLVAYIDDVGGERPMRFTVEEMGDVEFVGFQIDDDGDSIKYGIDNRIYFLIKEINDRDSSVKDSSIADFSRGIDAILASYIQRESEVSSTGGSPAESEVSSTGGSPAESEASSTGGSPAESEASSTGGSPAESEEYIPITPSRLPKGVLADGTACVLDWDTQDNDSENSQ